MSEPTIADVLAELRVLRTEIDQGLGQAHQRTDALAARVDKLEMAISDLRHEIETHTHDRDGPVRGRGRQSNPTPHRRERKLTGAAAP